MNPELMKDYLASRPPITRRSALALGAAAAVAAAGVAGGDSVAGASTGVMERGGGRRPRPRFDDEIFDYADPANLSDWVPSRYGAGDQRGAFNEVTRRVTAHACAR